MPSKEEQREWALIGTFKLNRGVIVVISKATESMLALYKACSLRPYEDETANSVQSNGQQNTENFFQAQASLGSILLETYSSRCPRSDLMSSLLKTIQFIYRCRLASRCGLSCSKIHEMFKVTTGAIRAQDAGCTWYERRRF